VLHNCPTCLELHPPAAGLHQWHDHLSHCIYHAMLQRVGNALADELGLGRDEGATGTGTGRLV
jgi:hypothetical protein